MFYICAWHIVLGRKMALGCISVYTQNLVVHVTLQVQVQLWP